MVSIKSYSLKDVGVSRLGLPGVGQCIVLIVFISQYFPIIYSINFLIVDEAK